jgi:flagellar assembly factor FliW
MKISTTRFGTLEASENELYTFPDGLLGFERYKRFLLLENPDGGPLKWLQSAEEGGLAFVICDPTLFVPDYRVALRSEEVRPIALDDASRGYVFVILVVPADPQKTTANLQGPLILNLEKRLARQVILPEGNHSTRHPVFPQAAPV